MYLTAKIDQAPVKCEHRHPQNSQHNSCSIFFQASSPDSPGEKPARSGSLGALPPPRDAARSRPGAELGWLRRLELLDRTETALETRILLSP